MDFQSLIDGVSQGHYTTWATSTISEMPAYLADVPNSSGSPTSSTDDQFPATLGHGYYYHIVDDQTQLGSHSQPMPFSDLDSDHESHCYNSHPIQHCKLAYIPSSESTLTEATNIISTRRRAQNRAAQRAFRERKEKYVRHLEAQVADLADSYTKLKASYSQLEAAHEKLRTAIRLLTKDDEADRQNVHGETTN
ncbi:uncharacterized protein ALTATR162_LOCUS5060 [Alternaria atra]|uniref:BZIP domain-containing protein n=1 Tax=Alternaria atra TaxID=119953 RepID=A0A8J2N1E1_9PLEO|nr:uncharacterized protein ALTATR162_LOCUS5060 [Alternaria atra]CAG5158254.1 unnamed protein product [Alternaria atra]